MFDDNESNGFLTDDHGRRVYCPPFGPARWVPSLEEEENLGRLKFRVIFVAMIVAVIGTTALLSMWEQSLSTLGAWMALAFGVQALCASYYVRRWPAIPQGEFSYARCVLERQSLMSLRFAVALSAIACVGFAIGPIWFVVHYQASWIDLTPLKKVVFAGLPLMLTLVSPYYALGSYRAWSVLRKRMLLLQ